MRANPKTEAAACALDEHVRACPICRSSPPLDAHPGERCATFGELWKQWRAAFDPRRRQ
jgi:hypothetical protein